MVLEIYGTPFDEEDTSQLFHQYYLIKGIMAQREVRALSIRWQRSLRLGGRGFSPQGAFHHTLFEAIALNVSAIAIKSDKSGGYNMSLWVRPW